MNVFTFSGNLGNNAEQRATKSGTPVCQFSVATTSGYGDRKKTTWARCTLFGKRGESLAPYLVKGQQVVVSGEASLNEWESKDGTRTSLEVNVNDVTLVGGKPEQRQEPQQARQAAPPLAPPTAEQFDEDTIPF